MSLTANLTLTSPLINIYHQYSSTNTLLAELIILYSTVEQPDLVPLGDAAPNKYFHLRCLIGRNNNP